MKKYDLLILVVMLISCTKAPIDSFSLKVRYLPQTNYNYSSEQTIHSEITYSGKEKSLKELKKRGIQNPTVINKNSTTGAIIRTGKLEEDHSEFPVKVEYTSVVTNNGIKAAPVNAVFHGKCFTDSIPVFDVAVANTMDKQSKMHLLESWQQSISQFSFASHKLKVGEEYVTKEPSAIPMEGSMIDMMVTTSYKLTSIKNNIADFDISQQYALNPKLLDNSFQGTVKGHGHLVYDIEHSMVMNHTLDTEMELIKKLDSFEFHLKTNHHVVQKTSIGNNSK
ncbi:MAG: hypothetical protein ACM3P1_01690 [Candidatus Saccharibacteria bacterium]